MFVVTGGRAPARLPGRVLARGHAFALLGNAFEVFDMRLLSGLPSRYFGVMVNDLFPELVTWLPGVIFG